MENHFKDYFILLKDATLGVLSKVVLPSFTAMLFRPNVPKEPEVKKEEQKKD